METIRNSAISAFSFGTFGDLVSAVSGLFSSGGIELTLNFGLILCFVVAGYRIGQWATDTSLAFATAASVVGCAMFGYGAPAWFFLVNAGTFLLGFLFPVWREASRRVSY